MTQVSERNNFTFRIQETSQVQPAKVSWQPRSTKSNKKYRNQLKKQILN